MKHFLLTFLLGFILVGCQDENTNTDLNDISVSDQILLNAFETGQTDLQVDGQGIVVSLLADDTTGSQHQRFILKLTTGQTLLIAHNIDLAPKIYYLEEGDLVKFYGEYEWNDKGGVVHWTHIDPNGAHEDGWLIHDGVTYH